MFYYVEDRSFLRLLKSDCADTINRLVQEINNEDIVEVYSELVGSGARNLITCNGNGKIDLDYNLIITDVFQPFSEENLKKYIKNCFDNVLNKKDMGYSNDSTSCLSTKYFYFKSDKNKREFKIDLAIIKEDNFGIKNRLIHQKKYYRCNIAFDSWYWNQCPNSKNIFKRAKQLKKKGHWDEIKDVYLNKKNMYLTRQDNNHSSYICYIETINEVYNKYCNKHNI